MDEHFLNTLKNYLSKTHQCHSIILYGSYADETYNSESDIDVICFSDHPIQTNDVSIFQGHALDAWIYPTAKMNEPANFLHISVGVILTDERQLCCDFLKGIKEGQSKGPLILSSEEKAFLKSWLNKMLKRSERGDCEGDFRAHWLLVDALEIYFKLIDQTYLGPKKSLAWLKQNDLEFYKYYESALKPGADSISLRNLIELFFTDVKK